MSSLSLLLPAGRGGPGARGKSLLYLPSGFNSFHYRSPLWSSTLSGPRLRPAYLWTPPQYNLTNEVFIDTFGQPFKAGVFYQWAGHVYLFDR